MSATYLDIVKETDCVPYPGQAAYATEVEDSSYIFLSHDGVPIGRIVTAVVQQIKKEPDSFEVSDASRSVRIVIDTLEARNKLFADLALRWKNENLFAVLLGWRDELYTVYNPTTVPYFAVERAAAALFGVVTYGIHIVGYIPSHKSKDGELKIWVPRRAYNKATFPGMLDNMVAGGLGNSCGILETAIKECGEEAGLSVEYVTPRLKAVGVITYFYRHTYEDGLALFQPEVEYIYDLEMEPDTIPQPTDGEVAEFTLMSGQEVVKAMKAREFKPNTALVQIDFFIRHNIITPENEPDYIALLQSTHRRFEYPTR